MAITKRKSSTYVDVPIGMIHVQGLYTAVCDNREPLEYATGVTQVHHGYLCGVCSLIVRHDRRPVTVAVLQLIETVGPGRRHPTPAQDLQRQVFMFEEGVRWAIAQYEQAARDMGL